MDCTIFWKHILLNFENNSSISLSHIFVFKLGNKDQGINGPVKLMLRLYLKVCFMAHTSFCFDIPLEDVKSESMP